jgi:excisionase family DNA binding protein
VGHYAPGVDGCKAGWISAVSVISFRHLPDDPNGDALLFSLSRKRIEQMSHTTDALQQAIEQAVEAAIRKALNINDATNRRLLSVEEGAVYLALSKREVYNMIATGELPAVTHGRRRMLDIRDLDVWIECAKKRR